MVSASPPYTTTLPEPLLAHPPAESSNTKAPSPTARTKVPSAILFAIAAFGLIGIAFALWVRTVAGSHPDPRLTYNVFYVLFARNEPLGLLTVVLFSLISAVVLLRKNRGAAKARDEDVDLARWLCPIIALIVFAVAALGTQFVLHDYPLTADEYLADFQARIFLRGKIEAEVPAALQDAIRVITPTYVDYIPSRHSWHATYLPVYAAMRAVFQSAGLQSLLNPALAAITILALYGVARNLWPEKKANALVAAALLASSSQFLLMAMTSYAMPAHLALNTVWLWLYSRPDRRAFYLAPVVGVLAMGLHQPFVHALFAAPFLLRLVWQRRWRPVVIFAAVYLAGCVTWYLWMKHYQAPNAAGAKTLLRLFNPRMLIIQPMNLLLLIGWASLATPLFAILGFRRVFHLPPIVQDAAASCLLTFGFYYFFFLDQAHGWGYRYFHGALGCMVLVAVAGWNRLSHLIGQRRAVKFLASGVAFSLLIQLPLRCFQAESFVRPFARTAAVFHAFPKDIVAFDGTQAWYSGDLIRNDPFLQERPLIVSLFGLTPAAVAALEKMGTVQFVTRDDLTRLGMSTTRSDNYKRDPLRLGAPPDREKPSGRK
jgi:hypothetical protein